MASSEEPTVIKVENPWKNAAFLKYIPYLVDHLSCRTIRLACVAKGLISSTEKTKLMNIEDPNAHNDDLVDMLCRGDASSFHSFLEIIRDNEPKGNFREFLNDMKAVDKVAESKRFRDRKQMDGYMQGFNSPQRGRALGFAQGIHKRANQINDKTTGKPRLIHLPNRPQASVVTAFLKDGMSAGDREVLDNEIERVNAHAEIVEKGVASLVSAGQLGGSIKRPGDEEATKSPEAIKQELRNRHCYVDVSGSFEQSKRYLSDIGYIDGNSTVTEVLCPQVVWKQALLIRGSSMIEERDKNSCLVKLIIDVVDEMSEAHTDAIVGKVMVRLGELLGEKISWHRVHRERGGAAVIAQMSGRAKGELYAICRDHPGIMPGISITDVLPVDGDVVLSMRPPSQQNDSQKTASGVENDEESRGNLAKDLGKACPAAEHKCQDIHEQHDYEYATMRSAQIMFNTDVSFRTVANIVHGADSRLRRPAADQGKPRKTLFKPKSRQWQHLGRLPDNLRSCRHFAVDSSDNLYALAGGGDSSLLYSVRVDELSSTVLHEHCHEGTHSIHGYEGRLCSLVVAGTAMTVLDQRGMTVGPEHHLPDDAQGLNLHLDSAGSRLIIAGTYMMNGVQHLALYSCDLSKGADSHWKTWRSKDLHGDPQWIVCGSGLPVFCCLETHDLRSTTVEYLDIGKGDAGRDSWRRVSIATMPNTAKAAFALDEQLLFIGIAEHPGPQLKYDVTCLEWSADDLGLRRIAIPFPPLKQLPGLGRVLRAGDRIICFDSALSEGQASDVYSLHLQRVYM
eukprot:scpid27401/ scgid25954/ 